MNETIKTIIQLLPYAILILGLAVGGVGKLLSSRASKIGARDLKMIERQLHDPDPDHDVISGSVSAIDSEFDRRSKTVNLLFKIAWVLFLLGLLLTVLKFVVLS